MAAPLKADLLLSGCDVVTVDGKNRVISNGAIAIRGNKIVTVGTDRAVNALKGPNTRIADLAGRVVLPGIIDAHVHPAQSAQDLDQFAALRGGRGPDAGRGQRRGGRLAAGLVEQE